MKPTLAIFNLGGGEILLILAMVLILFGAKKIPELARGLGQGIKEFKKVTSEVTDELNHAGNAVPSASKRIPSAATAAHEPEHTLSQTSPPNTEA